MNQASYKADFEYGRGDSKRGREIDVFILKKDESMNKYHPPLYVESSPLVYRVQGHAKP